MSQVKAGAAYVELTTRNAAFTKGLRAAQKQLQDFGNATKLLGSQLLTAGTTAAAPMAASLMAFTSFDDAIRAVKAVTQATEQEFELLRNKAKELGATTSYSASQVASLMTELGRAGFKPDHIVNMTAAVMDMARATGTDATLASGIMAATIRQFGLEAQDATRVADGLTAAANKSFNSVESLGESLKYAAPVAADANMSLEETLAILGTLGNMGIQGSDAGTSLRRLLTLTAAQAEAFNDVFGVATTDAVGNLRPLVDVLSDVAAATKDLPSGARAAKFAQVFGMLGITSASAIGKSVTDTRALYQELVNAGGAAVDTAKQMDSGIGGAFRILMSAAEGVAIAFGEAVDKPMQKVTAAISGTLSAIIRWIEANRRIVRMSVLVVGGVLATGAALVAIGTLFAVTGSVISGFLTTVGFVSASLAAVGTILGALLSPLGLVSVAVVALGAYLVYASGTGAQALDWLAAQFSALQSTVQTSLGAIGKALAAGDVAAAGRILWLTLKMEWQRGVQALQGYWLAFKDAFFSTTDAMIYGAAGILSDGWAAIETGWTETVAFLADAWNLFTSTLMQSWNSSIGFIRKAWVRLKGLFDEDIQVDAELAKIDADTTARNAGVSDNLLSGIADRDAARRARRAEIERERQGRAGALADMRDAEAQARDQANDSALAKTAAELDEARRAWREAIDEVQASTPAENTPPTSGRNLKSLADALGQAAQATAASSAVDTQATFNAFAIRGLGADTLSDRALRAAEATAANTKKIIEAVESSSMTYT